MDKLFDIFEEYLKNYTIKVDTFHNYYEEAFNYIIQAGGKRFRPMLLLSVVEGINPLLVRNSLPIALSLEMFHTYSLVHDDLPSMDDADLRRGKETIHKRYNDEVLAILVGDGLNTHSFNLICDSSFSSDTKVKLIKSLSYNGGISGMVLGQALDCHFENQILDIDKLTQIHTKKTAMLIASSLQMGGIIVDLPKDEIDKLYSFGIELGLLFQIQDDIIDFLSDEVSEGKPVGNDIDKNTFVNLLGIEKAIELADLKADKIKQILDNMDTKIRQNLEDLILSYIYRHRKYA